MVGRGLVGESRALWEYPWELYFTPSLPVCPSSFLSAMMWVAPLNHTFPDMMEKSIQKHEPKRILALRLSLLDIWVMGDKMLIKFF